MLEAWINDLLPNLSSKLANMNTFGRAIFPLLFFFFLKPGCVRCYTHGRYSDYYLQYTAVSTHPISGETGAGELHVDGGGAEK